MVANYFRSAVCCTLLGTTALSYAGLERFWLLFNSEENETQQTNCDSLTHEQQQTLIQNYQTLKDEDSKLDLQKRMAWFCQLSSQEQQLMREAWQNMSTTARTELRKKLETANTPEERTSIRQAFLMKYSLEN